MKNKYTAFFAAFAASVKAGNKATKEEAVHEFTGGRTSSLKDLTSAELHDLVTRLNAHSGFTPKRNFFQGTEQKMRLAFFPMAYEMGWAAGGDSKTAVARIDAWCRQQKYKTGFNDLDAKQLGILLTVFKEKVYKGFLKSL